MARRQYVSLSDAARHLGCNERTIRRMIAAGRLHGYRIGPRLIKVDFNELDNVVETIPAAKAG